MRPHRNGRKPTTLLLGVLLAIMTGCSSGGQGGASGDWTATHDTIGDTVVVRTLSGSLWRDTATLVPEVSIGRFDGPEEYIFGHIVSMAMGSDGTIYVMDQQVPALRVYDPDGSYRTTFGREGGGPGEYQRPDGGLNILSDGRILLRDPANARIQVYSPEGEDLATWRIRGGFNTSQRMIVDTLDRAYTIILLDPEADVRDWQMGLVQIHPDGSTGDTLKRPDVGYEAPRIEARIEDGDNVSVSRNGIPFTPDEETALTRFGYWIHGISTDYTFTLLKSDGPVRIEKVYEPIPVSDGERAEEEAFSTRNMRSVDPNWRWDGPAIPDVKPPYTAIYGGEDGSIWVQVSQAGTREEDPLYDPTEPDAIPDEWHEPVVFDVFEDDGRFLGTVRAPKGFHARWTAPVFTKDWVLGIVRDEFDIETVVKFRVELPGSRSPAQADREETQG